MYERHFSLTERPFSIAPDPRFLFLSGRHREALAHLVYGLNDDGGFVLVTGEVGTGKTTLCRCLLQQVPAHTDVAFVLNPRVSELELLQTICDELHITTSDPGSIKSLVDAINAHLLATHAARRNTVVIVDEAQNLTPAVLEQLRLLTNLETSERKLLRILLLGQPELKQILAAPELRQLAQRITARYHLSVLSRAETHQYVAHRLGVAGGDADTFTRSAIDGLHKLAGGVPRRINIIADRAMLGAYASGTRRITPAIVARAAREVAGELPNRRRWLPAVAIGTAAAVLLATTLYLRPWLPAVGAETKSAADAGAAGDQAPTTATTQALPPAAATTASASPTTAPTTAVPAPGAAQSQAASVASSQATSDLLLVEGEGALAESAGDVVITPQTAFADVTVAENATPLPAPGGDVRTLPVQRVEWPAGTPREASQRLALSALFARWRTPFAPPPDVELCAYATQSGLGCLEREGNWQLLRDVDRPAMLWLTDASGQSFWAALQALDDATGELDVGGNVQRVPIAAIDRQWRGRFVVLWQLPPGYVVPAVDGTRGADVAHLRERLEHLGGKAIGDNTARDVFDAPLGDALREFQARMGIEPDGVAGPNTWIAIDSLTADAPRLHGQAPRLHEEASPAREPLVQPTASAQES